MVETLASKRGNPPTSILPQLACTQSFSLLRPFPLCLYLSSFVYSFRLLRSRASRSKTPCCAAGQGSRRRRHGHADRSQLLFATSKVRNEAKRRHQKRTASSRPLACFWCVLRSMPVVPADRIGASQRHMLFKTNDELNTTERFHSK